MRLRIVQGTHAQSLVAQLEKLINFFSHLNIPGKDIFIQKSRSEECVCFQLTLSHKSECISRQFSESSTELNAEFTRQIISYQEQANRCIDVRYSVRKESLSRRAPRTRIPATLLWLPPILTERRWITNVTCT